MLVHPHAPNTGWASPRLKPFFIRELKQGLHPVGRVYEVKDAAGNGTGVFDAEIEEAYELVLQDPETGKEHTVIIDPRHPQHQQQLKIAQDVLEGRVGGMTPVMFSSRYAWALDPKGNRISGTKVPVVKEADSPQPHREELKGSNGEWTPELDREVDRATSLEIARRFSEKMDRLAAADDPARRGAMDSNALATADDDWTRIETRAQTKLAGQWRDSGMTDADIAMHLARLAPTRENALAGQFFDATGTVKQVAFDTQRDVPTDVAEQVAFAYQQAIVEDFTEEMQHVGAPEPVPGGTSSPTADILTYTELELVAAGRLPCARPVRHDRISRLVSQEKSREAATHLLAGMLQAKGAEVRNPTLDQALGDANRINQDIIGSMNTASVLPANHGSAYFTMAKARLANYREQADLRVLQSAKKTMKFTGGPAGIKQIPHSELLSGAIEKVAEHATEAGHSIEGISFGL